MQSFLWDRDEKLLPGLFILYTPLLFTKCSDYLAKTLYFNNHALTFHRLLLGDGLQIVLHHVHGVSEDVRHIVRQYLSTH